MIGIVIVAHGGLAKEYLAAIEHVVGPQPGIRAITIAADADRAEKQTEIQKLTISQAVARLDLSGLNALLFESDGRVNLVYRRNDGNIGWIDPGQ